MKTAASLYKHGENERTQFLMRARQCAELTLPALLPPDGHSSSSELPTPYQGLGARGVNNLASKSLITLFPANTPLFRLAIDDYTLEQLTQQEGQRANVESEFARIERSVTGEMEGKAARPKLFEALKHLIVTGNALLYVDQDNTLRVFRLDSYIVERDCIGNIKHIVVHEKIMFDALPDKTQASLREDAAIKYEGTDEVSLYTVVWREGKRMKVQQEVADKVVDGSQGSYPVDKSPWIACRWTSIADEDYGRGLVEEYIGDLISLEGLSQALLEGASAAARLLFLVRPSGVTDKEDLANAPNGEFVDGDVNDVATLKMDKAADFRVPYDLMMRLTERLSSAFLLNSSVQRPGERVTAEEIRYMARELEDTLGGVYSILSQELQLPLVVRYMFNMQKQKRLPELPEGVVSPMIVTGFDALGRGQDIMKLQQFLQAAQQLGPQAMGSINMGDALTRMAAALGIDTKGLVKTPQEIADEQQQAQNNAMMQAGTAPAVQAAGRMMEQANAPQGQA